MRIKLLLKTKTTSMLSMNLKDSIMDNVKSLININVFCIYLIRIGIEPTHVHNFGLIHQKRYNRDSIDMPKLESKNMWMECFYAYIQMLRCTKIGFKKNWLLADKELKND